jgi:hypothetical protein
MRQLYPVHISSGALINEMIVYGAGFATNGELYTLSRTMRA